MKRDRTIELLIDDLFALHDLTMPMPGGQGTYLSVRDVRKEARRKFALLQMAEQFCPQQQRD